MEWIYAFCGFFLVLVLIPLLRSLALRTGFVDQPGGRKQHEDPIAPVGGLAIVPVFILLSLVQGQTAFPQLIFYAALALITLIGFLDDRGHVNAWIKFFVQIVAAYALVAAGPGRVFVLGDLFGLGNFGLGWMSVPFSMAAIVLLVNAVNLMDGLDGLAGGIILIALAWLAAASLLNAASLGPAAPILILCGCLCGFLFYNLRHPFRAKASVFLGDAGSLALGLCLAWFAIGMAQGTHAVVTPMGVAWILALPIMDVCAQFYRRVREGRHPFSADRGHFHHHLIEAGFAAGQATAMILALSILSGAAGVVAPLMGVKLPVLTFAWIALILIHMYLSQTPQTYVRLFSYLQSRFCG